ncbi:MAG: hypothetical protein JNK77_08810 [Saprospiraceae bacterium]|nr:hypothetical protein [Saprospiraceae bacterium]
MKINTQALTDLPVLKSTLAQTTTLGLRADVVLGSPAAKCRGVGICRVVVAPHQHIGDCPAVHTIIDANIQGRPRFYFLRHTISAQVLDQHFSSGVFVVQETYHFSKSLIRRLRLGSPHILPGKYLIEVTDKYFIVDF